MRKIRNAISFILIAVILLSSAAVVSAEETQIDWSSVDFETFNFRELEDSQWRSLRDWLKTDADLHTVFYVTSTAGDGWIGEMWSGLVYSLFMLDPVPFIQALALEDEVTQEKTVLRIIYEADLFKEVFGHVVSELALPDTATAGERNVLAKIISRANEKWNMNITNPHTGDSIGFAALLMAVSGLGIAVLVKRRKLLA